MMLNLYLQNFCYYCKNKQFCKSILKLLMAIITLISDWQPNSIYLSAIKGHLFSKIPDIKVVDISHTIDAFNVNKAAFILKNTYKKFPDKTIHLICVASETRNDENYIVLEADNHFFISNDNGIFGLLIDENPTRIIKINTDLFEETTFPELTLFAEVAVKLSNNEDYSTFGEITNSYKKLFPLSATFEDDVIQGKVIYIDAYKNAISNISKELFEKIGKGRKFSIFIKSNRNKIEIINKKYSDSEPGEIMAIFNSMSLLEICQNKGAIADLLSLDCNSVIRINFFK